MWILRLATFLLVAVCATAGVASAAKKPNAAARAQVHFDRGVKDYNVGRFVNAIAEFQKAYDLDPVPIFLFNIAQSHRQMGNKERALFFYRRCLEAKDLPNRPDVERRVAELESALREDEAARRAATEPPPTQAAATAPPATGTPAALQFAPAAAADTSISTTAEEPRPVWKRWWFWTGAAVVVAGAVTTGLLLSSGGEKTNPCRMGEVCTNF